VSVVRYRETIWSDLFPGNQHTVRCLRPAVRAASTAVQVATCISVGSWHAATISSLKGWQTAVRARWLNKSGARTPTAASGWAKSHHRLTCRPVRVFVKRRLKKGQYCHSYYIATLSLPSKGHFWVCYDGHGGAKVE
jgi:hypothetical protein